MAQARIESTKRGSCKVCRKNLPSSAMIRHIKTHIRREKPGTHYIIRVGDGSLFWMFLQVPANSTLQSVDDFLRNAWLECCGHLSSFEIYGEIYDSTPGPDFSGHKNKSMKYKLSKVLTEDTIFSYEYDFGSTTSLMLEVKAVDVQPLIPFSGIHILAIHDKVRFICDVCGGEATKICAMCGIYEDDGLLCDKCLVKHRCVLDEEDEDVMMDVCQSPRVGVCAYQYDTRLHD